MLATVTTTDYETRILFAECERCQAYRIAPTLQLAGVGVGAAVLDQWASALDSERWGKESYGTLRTWRVTTTARAIGLLHFAAVGGHSEAQLAIGLRQDVHLVATHSGTVVESTWMLSARRYCTINTL